MHRTQKGIENTVDIVLSKGVTAHLNTDCPGGYSNMEWRNCDIQCTLHISTSINIWAWIHYVVFFKLICLVFPSGGGGVPGTTYFEFGVCSQINFSLCVFDMKRFDHHWHNLVSGANGFKEIAQTNFVSTNHSEKNMFLLHFPTGIMLCLFCYWLT